MTTDQFNAARKKLGLNQATAAKKLHLSRMTIYNYAHGKNPIPELVAMVLRAMIRLGTTDI